MPQQEPLMEQKYPQLRILIDSCPQMKQEIYGAYPSWLVLISPGHLGRKVFHVHRVVLVETIHTIVIVK